jgi:DNA-binding Lrp family transcriptional regulator
MNNQTGFWIPMDIWSNEKLSLIEKAVLSDVISLSNEGSTYFKSSTRMSSDLGVSVATVKRAVRSLVALGYIKTDVVNGRNRTIIPIDRLKMTPPVVQIDPRPVQNDTPPVSKRPRSNTDSSLVSSIVEIVLPWSDVDFKAMWDLWLLQRRKLKIKLYTDIGQQSALKRLQTLSNNDKRRAIEIIEHSIAQGYQGIYADRKTTEKKPIDTSILENYIRSGKATN